MDAILSRRHRRERAARGPRKEAGIEKNAMPPARAGVQKLTSAFAEAKADESSLPEVTYSRIFTTLYPPMERK
jgi:hypothetical protein